MNPMPEEQTTIVVDISNEDRDWTDVIPDQWFYPDHVKGREVLLKVKGVENERIGEQDKPFLTFENDPKRLGLNRENRLVLRALFGTPAKTKGQWITITALPSRGIYSIKILPRVTVEPQPVEEMPPPPNPRPAGTEKRKPRPKRELED